MNIFDPKYSKYSYFTLKIAEDIVLRHYSQDGIDKNSLKPYMEGSFLAVCEAIDKDCDALWTKAWEAAGAKN